MPDHGYFYWNELYTHDAEAARKRYGEALGWTYDSMPMESGGSYALCKVGDRMVGGIFPMEGPHFEGVPEHWLSYIAVDDIDKRVDKARTLGFDIKREPFSVPGIGRIAVLKDPGGAMIGWMTPEQDN